jgi:hypothetical protein
LVPRPYSAYVSTLVTLKQADCFPQTGSVVMGLLAAASPRFTARMTGLFYLLYVALAQGAIFARRGLIVSRDPAATATNIMAHQSLYQLGNACDILSIASNVVVVVLFFQLLKWVNGSVSKLAACFGIMGLILMAVGGVFQLAPLPVLRQASYTNAFGTEQLQAQAFLLLNLYNQAYSIALVLFGLFDLLIGYLIFKSTFLPRIVGVLMSVAGVSFLTFLAPEFGSRNLQWIVAIAFGEGVVILWLLVKGVDAERWKEQARAAAGLQAA